MNFDRDVAFPNKIRIIDLLNKIANGEEVPKYIKYYDKLHQREDIMMCCYNNIIYKLDNNIIDLLDEVEIIEEEKKIPEKIPIGLKQTKDGIFNTIVKDNIQYELNEKEEIICRKIHELIDYLKSKGDE